jgi:hypothetical protein
VSGKIAPERIADARALKHGSEVEVAPSGRARCRQCFQLIEKGVEGIVFASGLAFPATVAYLHADPAMCEAHPRAPKKLKLLKPIEPSWVLSSEDLETARHTSIADHRRPRRRVICRGCGGAIELHQDRLAYKLRDEAGWEVRDAEGRYIGNGFLHANLDDCQEVA